MKRSRQGQEKGIASLELALILPWLLIMVFWIIDFGRLMQASLIVTNVSREGGSIVSRSFNSGQNLLDMLVASGSPLNLNGSGRIYVTRIAAGTSPSHRNPTIDTQFSRGSLGVTSSTSTQRFGLTNAIYQHLRYRETDPDTGAQQNTSDIAEVWIVEVYYLYSPITPLPNFIQNLVITPGYNGRVIGSRAVF
ncbi:MAG: TadE/TadG family type IV pilus assembly protein [bacterium]